jgi:hypothetical protein
MLLIEESGYSSSPSDVLIRLPGGSGPSARDVTLKGPCARRRAILDATAVALVGWVAGLR